MKKLLYIGHYRDGTGWANAAIDTILTLDKCADVVCRPLKLNDSTPEIPKRIKELENRSFDKYDICVQHVLPHLMECNSNVGKNVGYFHTESTNFIACNWSNKLNQMDEFWTNWNGGYTAARESGVTIPGKKIDFGLDPSKYISTNKLDFGLHNENFKFYFIGDGNRRKNLIAALKAFHLAFSPLDNVSFVVHVSQYGKTSEDITRYMKNATDTVKRELKLYSDITFYKDEVLVPNKLTEQEILDLHATCDCFIMPSFGEAYNLPCRDALASGNTVICNEYSYFGEKSLCEDRILCVSAATTPVFGMNDTFQELSTGWENWCDINVPDLVRAMQKAVTMKKISNTEYLENNCYAAVAGCYEL